MRLAFVRQGIVAVSLALCAASPANAEPAKDRTLEEQVKAGGDALMTERRYAEALDAYDRAFAFYPDERLYYNRGSAYAALDRFPEALEQFEFFRERAPADLRARVPDLDTLIERTREKVASISVVTSVHGALVTLRGQVVGTTPIERPVRVNAGAATLEIRAEGYDVYRQEVSLKGKRLLRLEPHLLRHPGTTLLVIRSRIVGTLVKLDGRTLGTAPAEAIVTPGAHRVTLSHPDYETAELSTIAPRGESRTLNVELEGKKSVFTKWWLWTGVGVIAVGTVAAVLVHNAERSPDRGDIAPGQVSSPLTGRF